MTALADARGHLNKAKEFLEAARFDLDRELYNAATSAAVISGINSKDAICLALTGRTGKSDNHMDAVADLKAAGRAGAEVSSTLSRLLRQKSKSQYIPTSVAASDAVKAVEWAQRLLDVAEATVAGR